MSQFARTIFVIINGLWAMGYGMPTVSVLPPSLASLHPFVQQAENPEQVVETLISLPHGIHKLSPNNKDILDRVIQDPDPYLDALRSLYAEHDVAAVQKPSDVMRMEQAILLLGTIGSSDALSQLAQWYAQLDSASEDSAYEYNLHNILQLRRIILVSLDETKQEDVTASVLNTLTEMDYATQIAALEYLAHTSSAEDEDILIELGRYLNDVGSPLYQDPVLDRTLDAIEENEN